jgi:hypothetical protein
MIQDGAELPQVTVFRETVVKVVALLKHHLQLQALSPLPRVHPLEVMEGAERPSVVLLVTLLVLLEDVVQHMGMFYYY